MKYPSRSWDLRNHNPNDQTSLLASQSTGRGAPRTRSIPGAGWLGASHHLPCDTTWDDTELLPYISTRGRTRSSAKEHFFSPTRVGSVACNITPLEFRLGDVGLTRAA